MKTKLIAAFVAAPFAFTGAMANETEAFCVDFATGNGWDTEPCACVGEVGEGNAGVKEEILALSSAEEVDLMSDATKEALAGCFPENS